jgi:hypothetical protein
VTNEAEKLNYRKLQALFIRRSDGAVLVEFPPRTDRVWIPRTLISSKCDLEAESLFPNDEWELELIRWKAEQMGL